MKKIIIVLVLMLVAVPAISEKIKIFTEDEAMFVFKNGAFDLDSHRYQSLYEVDFDNHIIIAVYDIDLGTGEKYEGNSVFQLVPKPTNVFSPEDIIKGFRINPKTAGIETIVFYDGQFHYSKTQDTYINLASGTYTIEKNKEE